MSQGAHVRHSRDENVQVITYWQHLNLHRKETNYLQKTPSPRKKAPLCCTPKDGDFPFFQDVRLLPIQEKNQQNQLGLHKGFIYFLFQNIIQALHCHSQSISEHANIKTEENLFSFLVNMVGHCSFLVLTSICKCQN